jgi:hypothetical protein
MIDAIHNGFVLWAADFVVGRGEVKTRPHRNVGHLILKCLEQLGISNRLLTMGMMLINSIMDFVSRMALELALI